MRILAASALVLGAAGVFAQEASSGAAAGTITVPADEKIENEIMAVLRDQDTADALVNTIYSIAMDTANNATRRRLQQRKAIALNLEGSNSKSVKVPPPTRRVPPISIPEQGPDAAVGLPESPFFPSEGFIAGELPFSVPPGCTSEEVQQYQKSVTGLAFRLGLKFLIPPLPPLAACIAICVSEEIASQILKGVEGPGGVVPTPDQTEELVRSLTCRDDFEFSNSGINLVACIGPGSCKDLDVKATDNTVALVLCASDPRADEAACEKVKVEAEKGSLAVVICVEENEWIPMKHAAPAEWLAPAHGSSSRTYSMATYTHNMVSAVLENGDMTCNEPAAEGMVYSRIMPRRRVQPSEALTSCRDLDVVAKPDEDAFAFKIALDSRVFRCLLAFLGGLTGNPALVTQLIGGVEPGS